MVIRSGQARRGEGERCSATLDDIAIVRSGFPLGTLVKHGELQADDLAGLRMIAPLRQSVDDLKNWKAAHSICWREP